MRKGAGQGICIYFAVDGFCKLKDQGSYIHRNDSKEIKESDKYADLKEEIESQRESNLNTAYRIQILEEELENISDQSESDDEDNDHSEEEKLEDESIDDRNLESYKKDWFETKYISDDDEEMFKNCSDEDKLEKKSFSIKCFKSSQKDELDETDFNEDDDVNSMIVTHMKSIMKIETHILMNML